MGEQSKIQWTDATWNPWHGCVKVSPGCKFCYMYRDKDRYGQDPTHVMRSKSNFNQPLKWKEPRLIFTCSWSDWFIEQADEWRDEAWRIIKDTPHHTYQILTKRPERILECLPDDWDDGYENVWLGVSIESDEQYWRKYALEEVSAAKRFISFEPLIKEIMIEDSRGMDWIIIGGESGNEEGKWKYRPCEIEWIEKLINDGHAWGVDVFVKQLGTHIAKQLNLKDRHGGNIEEWPEQLRVREMPSRPII